jgi:transposase
VARSLGISVGAISATLGRAQAASLDWAGVEALSEAELEARLYGEGGSGSAPRPLPDWAAVHTERQRRGVTLALLHLEYREQHPEGYGYTQFCEHYRRWCQRRRLSMRQIHRAGEKMFVDYAGDTVDVIDRRTGEVRKAQIFVAVLGASNATFAEATWDQSLPNWIESHVRAFEFFGGVPEIVVPDNLRSGVKTSCRYEPEINPTYLEMAVHYDTVVIPARVRKARDKAKVEVGVQVVGRWILAALRKRTFFSLQELNAAIAELLHRLNRRPFKKLEGSRWSVFESLDKPALRPLPQERYELAQWKKARVNIDYHVEFDFHYYSVPFRFAQEEVEIRSTQNTVEVFRNRKRIASHRRSFERGKHTTTPEHMPKSHQKYAEWSPSRLIRWAQTIGESSARLVQAILQSRPHPEQGYRSCLGILRLSKEYERERLEAACQRALDIHALSYKSVKSILKNGLDRQPGQQRQSVQPVEHGNVRGNGYYR